MKSLQQIRIVVERAHTGLVSWATGLLDEADLALPVSGSMPQGPQGPTLVLLPYQVVLESQPTVPRRTLVPLANGATPGNVSPLWTQLGHAMTGCLIDFYPKRKTKSPGLGPLNPCPPLAELSAPLRDWYERYPNDWVISGTHGRLPAVEWRQAYSFVVRYAAIVVDTAGEAVDLDVQRLVALALVGAGVRHRRFFGIEIPPEAVEESLLELIEAMRDTCDGELRETLASGVAAARVPKNIAVGVYAHNEFTDADLALAMQALHQPMQPAVVFALRLSLGGGPELASGAIPHVEPPGFKDEAP